MTIQNKVISAITAGVLLSSMGCKPNKKTESFTAQNKNDSVRIENEARWLMYVYNLSNKDSLVCEGKIKRKHILSCPSKLRETIVNKDTSEYYFKFYQLNGKDTSECWSMFIIGVAHVKNSHFYPIIDHGRFVDYKNKNKMKLWIKADEVTLLKTLATFKGKIDPWLHHELIKRRFLER